MSDTKRKFQQKSQLEHVYRRPDTYIGSATVDTIPMYVLESGEVSDDDTFVLNDVEFTSGLLKIFDEILVNAIDQYTTYPDKVNYIRINFDIEDGEISIENGGPGIPVIEVETIHDGKMYQPQAVFSQFLTGDNFEDGKDKIVGGKNGLGATCANAFSDYFKVRTYDTDTNKVFEQVFKNRVQEIGEPIIVDKDDLEDELDEEELGGYTRITFIPSYKAFGYKEYTTEVGEALYKLFTTRAYQTAVFVNDSCKVYLNDGLLYVGSEDKSKFRNFAEMFVAKNTAMYITTLRHPKDKKLDLEVCIGISDGKARNISILNGISVYEGGTHIKYITNEIVEHIMPKIIAELPKDHAKVQPSVILNNLFIIVKGSIVNPSFSSQCKSKLTTASDVFNVYKFKDKGKNDEWGAIWEILKPYIMSTLIGKLKDKVKTRVTRGKVMLKKGSDAKFAGHKTKFKDCLAFIAEGDSAMGLIDSGINHKKTELNRDYCGTYSIQGVPLNARKEIDVMTDKENSTIIRNDKLKKNIRFNDLEKFIGLDYEKKYALDENGDKEFKTLRYGSIIVATDQDSDGKGQIFSLILNFFALFWPNLIKRKYITRLNTPVIRAYPKKSKKIGESAKKSKNAKVAKVAKVMEFYSVYEFKKWLKLDYNDDNDALSKDYNIKYYKGLASNKNDEIVPIFSNFSENLNIYEFDDFAQETLETYFGKDTNLRKEVLCTPVDEKVIIDCDKSRIVKVSSHLNNDLKDYQRENIMRKLVHVVDGMVPSRRKALFGARLNKKMDTDAIKVVNFTGSVMEKCGYHHGDASLSQTIIKMAQTFIGAKNLPYLIGEGQFGTRRAGGSDHGSARYIFIKTNKKLTNAIFPPQDDFLLPYVFDDGDRVEPEYFCPIIPMSVLENASIPATGWALKVWARDIDKVFRNVRRMVLGEIKECKKLPIWLRDNTSDVRKASDGKQYMVGKYEFNEKSNIVRITELPISIYNKNYIKNVAMNKEGTYIKEIKNVEDYSNYDDETNIDEIDIQFELKPEAFAEIKAKYDLALKSGKKIMRDQPKKTKLQAKATKSKTNNKDDNDKDIDNIINNINNIDINDKDDVSDITSIKDLDDDMPIDVPEYNVDPLFDCIEEFFKLRLCVTSNINMIGVSGEVMEFDYYGTVVNMWFAQRKRLYIERIERQLILKKLYIIYLENIIRFSKERDKMKITAKTPLDKFNEILDENEYARFNKPLLLNPKYMPADELNAKILNDGDSSYNYIIDLTYRSLLKEACEDREKELQKEKNNLELLNDDCHTSGKCFIGQKTWLRELDELEPIIANGLKFGWDKK